LPGAAIVGGGDGRGAVLRLLDGATGAEVCDERPLWFPAESETIGWLELAPAGGVLAAFERTDVVTGARSVVMVRYATP
ncbi:MAG TPA: hypothetical protein PKA64_24505, partial [Myxococcota bacterium]|nr:hypothetical protein [Myxococcota bacterium]